MMASNNQLVASALCLCMLLYTAVSCATPPPPPSISAPTPSTTAPTPSPTPPKPLTPSTAAPSPSTTAPTPSPSRTGLPPPIENTPPPPAGRAAPSGGVDVHKCWSSIQRVEGCVWEIYRAIIQFRFGSIGPACCEVIVGIDENCWPKMFPFAQQLDALLKSKCGAGHT